MNKAESKNSSSRVFTINCRCCEKFEFRNGSTQFTFDDSGYLVTWDRCYRVLEAREGFNVVGRQQVWPGAQYLTELDKAWAQLFKGASQSNSMVFLLLPAKFFKRKFIIIVLMVHKLGCYVMQFIFSQDAKYLEITFRMTRKSVYD